MTYILIICAVIGNTNVPILAISGLTQEQCAHEKAQSKTSRTAFCVPESKKGYSS